MKEKQYDEIILATGSVPLRPRIPGIDSENVCLATDVLSCAVNPAGEKVLVLGAGLVGVETAELMVVNGNTVTVVDMLSEPALLAPATSRAQLLANVKAQSVTFVMNSKVAQIFFDGIQYERDGELEELRGFDRVVLAFGTQPNVQLQAALANVFTNVHMIGDAKKAGYAKKAIFEATELAIHL